MQRSDSSLGRGRGGGKSDQKFMIPEFNVYWCPANVFFLPVHPFKGAHTASSLIFMSIAKGSFFCR
jgi:hypothetical protein